MAVGPSMWWPTPSEPGRWFEARDILTSRQRDSSRSGLRAATRASDITLIPLDDDSLHSLAAGLGLANVDVMIATDVAEINAFARRQGGRDTVTMSEGLTRQPTSLRNWIVAHELVHLRHHHQRRLLSIGLVLAALVVGIGLVLGLAAAFGVAVLCYLVHRWLARAFERQADIEASRHTTRPDIRDLQGMTLAMNVNLAPSMLQRLLQGHPAPAERLELLSRL